MEDKIRKKIEYFEYFIYKLKYWYEENGCLNFNENMSRVKAEKLLFLCSSIKNPYGEDLLDIFDNFYALPNGMLEQDIHNAMVEDNMKNMSFKDRKFIFKNLYFNSLLNDLEKERIDIAIGCLKAVNSELVRESPMELSEINKKWICWKTSWMVAESLKKQSEKTTLEIIRNSKPYFK